MKPYYLVSVLFFVLMMSCRSGTALEYSEAIVKMEAELSDKIAEMDEKVKYYLKAKKKDSAIKTCKKMENLAAQKLKEVQKLKVPAFAESENFKKAAIRYFTFVKNIYSSFSRFTAASSDEEKELERRYLLQIIDQRKEIVADIQQAQKKFALANNFTIERVEKLTAY